MLFSKVAKWENTSVGKRGDEYLAWKEDMAKKLLSLVDEMHPGFLGCVDAVNSSSPLTIRDCYGVKEGAICGFSKDCHNIALSQVPVVTKIQNLLLTGQNNNLHGFCGVPLTAINTCEAILGINYIIDKINKCTEL
jgi:all-trans-retinol 13,14-reductase